MSLSSTFQSKIFPAVLYGVLVAFSASTLFAADPPADAATDPPPVPKPMQQAEPMGDGVSAKKAVGADSKTGAETKHLSTEDHAAAVAALVERERAYFDAVYAKNRDQVKLFLATDAVFFDDSTYRGKTEYLRIMEPFFEGKFDFSFTATPLEAHVAGSGEIAWTSGSAVTAFVRPGKAKEKVEFDTHYMLVWTRQDDGPWMIRAYSPLVIHNERGQASEPRSALMMAWPPLNEMVGATVKIEWTPERTERAASGEMAYGIGEFHVQFKDGEESEAGVGGYIAVWQKDDKGRWQLAGEGYSPPQIYGSKE